MRVGCDTCKIPEKCETVFGSAELHLIDKHLTLPDENYFSKRNHITQWGGFGGEFPTFLYFPTASLNGKDF